MNDFRSVAIALALAFSIAPVCGQAIPVPNGSFESPKTPFADPRIDAWQKSPKPVWFEETEVQKWDQLTGVFMNTAPGSPDRIDNMDGDQAIFFFAVPEVALFQDYNSTDWQTPEPTHAFNAKFEVGKGYQLKAGVYGGGGNMLEGVSLQVALYYRDAASNQVVVAATTIEHSKNVFTPKHFIDFQVDVPTVKASDPWAGEQIGIRLLSTVAPNLVGGYWDIDNVRLTALPGVSLTDPARGDTGFTFTVRSEPGAQFEVLATDDLSLPLASWTTLGTVTNVTGATAFTDAGPNVAQRFYQVRQVP
ncbi:MAG: hypothetical protein AB9869_20155 [Verrucomicrobiia bacterium]